MAAKRGNEEMRGLNTSGATAEETTLARESVEDLGPLLKGPPDGLCEHLFSLPETALSRGAGCRAPRGGACRLGRIHAEYGILAYQTVQLMARVQGSIAAALLASGQPDKEPETVAWTGLLAARLDPMPETYMRDGAATP